MLHIILVILKALGILLAAVLLLILSVLLLLLFVPIRYRISASYLDDEKWGRGHVTWLFHLISFRISYVFGDKPKFLLKILGIPVFPKPVKEAKKPAAIEEVPKKTPEKQPQPQPAREQKSDASPAKTVQVPPKEPVTEPASPQTPPALEKTAPPAKKGIFVRISEIIEKIKAAILAFKEKLRTVFQKVTEIKTLINHYLGILKEEQTKALIKSTWGYILYILKHYTPHKIKGHIQYGLKDPSLTGQLTGVLYIIRPSAFHDLDLQPVFETDETVIKGAVDMKGHIRICHILYVGLKLLFDKNLKHVLKRIKK